MNTEDIARRAHGIWEMAGRPQGKAVEHWLQAEVELTEMLQDPPVTATTPAPAPKRLQRKKATSRRPAAPSAGRGRA
jgi:hypothetical protein